MSKCGACVAFIRKFDRKFSGRKPLMCVGMCVRACVCDESVLFFLLGFIRTQMFICNVTKTYAVSAIFNKNTSNGNTSGIQFCLPPIYLHNLNVLLLLFGRNPGGCVYVCRKCLFDIIISGNKCYYNECIICLITNLYNNFSSFFPPRNG